MKRSRVQRDVLQSSLRKRALPQRFEKFLEWQNLDAFDFSRTRFQARTKIAAQLFLFGQDTERF